ncbi:MAG TPA: hypothetical protein VJU82_04420, partial [Acidobacteriaceae bacterium]|nr:hypothetical protein [Acidobacteriaceae bacterium]
MPRIPGISIALVAMLLGIMVAPRFMPASDISSDSYLGCTAIGVLAIAVAALVVLKSQADRRSRT